MNFPLKQCEAVFQAELGEALSANEDRVKEMVESEGASSMDGVSFDILPWHDFVCLSFRTNQDEPDQIRYRYSPADWKHYEFVSEPFSATRELVSKMYESPPNGLEAAQVAHLIYVAAAEALMAPTVSSALRDCGLNAPDVMDKPNEANFEYVVIDEDRIVPANYCDVVLASRVTKRLMSKT